MTREQLGVCDAVSRHFGIGKNKSRAQVALYLEQNGESPLIELAIPEDELHIATTRNTIALGKMLFFKYLEKSELYSDVLNLFGNYEPEAIAFYSSSTLMVIYPEDGYDGFGGVFVRKNNDSRSGYVIEPIDHYLRHHYPVCPEN